MKTKANVIYYWILTFLFRKYPLIIFLGSFLLGLIALFTGHLSIGLNFSLPFAIDILFLFSCSIYWITIYKYISNQDHILVPDQYFNLNQTFFWLPVLGISIINTFFSFTDQFVSVPVLESFIIMIYFTSTAWFALHSTKFADNVSRDSSKLTTQFNIILFLIFTLGASFLLLALVFGFVHIDIIRYHYFFIPTALFSLVIINSLRATVPAISLIKKENKKNSDFALDLTLKKIEKELIKKVSNTILAQAEKDLQKQKKEIMNSIDKLAEKSMNTHFEAKMKKQQSDLNYGNLIKPSNE